MAQVINTNIASLTAQRTLAASQKEAATAMQRLSSGLRINSAKDDAAGLAIGNRLTAQINGINQAIRNANDGLSVAQVSEGALSESTNLLQRMRELAVQSANASNSSSDRAALQTEVTQLIAEMDRISTNTKFGNVSLLDGTFSAQSFQVGANASETLSVSIASSASSALGATSTSAAAVSFANFKSANATASAATPASGVAAQTLSVETNGTRTNVAVAAGASAAAITASFNAAQTDLVASASTGARLSITGGTTNNTTSVTINGQVLANLDVSSNATASASVASAIASNATLAASLTVTDNGDGTVDIRDSTGADILFDDITNTNGSATLSVAELNTAGTVISGSQTITSGQGTNVTGDITFTASDASKSFAIFSSSGTGNLSTATAARDGVGASENITFTGFNTAQAVSAAATPASGVGASNGAQTLTFVTDGSSQSIAVAAGASAADIAESVNTEMSGISAKAVTGARITVSGTFGGAGTYQLTINGEQLTTAVTAASLATTGDNIAARINAHVALSTTLTAVSNGDGTVDIFDATGADIDIEDITQATSTYTTQVSALDAQGVLSGTNQTIASGSGTYVTGDVVFTVGDTTKSYQMFANNSDGVTTSITSIAGTSTLTATTTTTTGSVNTVDISTAAGATSALATIDAALTTIDSQRATLGAVQNRFDSVISNLSNVSENTSAARSRIMDADFASETAQLARTQILQQAGISVLAQANAQPQNVLALLQ